MTEQPSRSSRPDTRYAVVLAEATRGIEGQVAAVDNLRSRIGLLLSAATVATAFLGGIALDDGPIGWPGKVAVVLFALHLTLGLIILWPWTWTFQTGASMIIDKWIDELNLDVGRVQRYLARYLAIYHGENKVKLTRLWRAYEAAILVLGVEVLLWLGELGGLEGWVSGVLSR